VPLQKRSFVEQYRGLIVAGVVLAAVLAVVVIVVLKFGPSNSGKQAAAGDTAADPSVVAAVTGIPQAVYDSVGAGSASNPPKAIQAPPLTTGGKPEVLYIGAEYCPYCAAERWALLAALSRFGSFSGLKFTHSSSSDVLPNTPTFSFVGATFSSQYLTWQSVELQTNQPNGSGGYTALQSPSADQQSVFNTYDKPPYVSSNGSIPFVDFGGNYVLSGATYDSSALPNKDWGQVSALLTNPNDPVTKGIVGSANVISAAICAATGNQPASVCSTPGVQAGAAALAKK